MAADYAALIGFLDQDPDNLTLIAEAAEAAYAEGDLAAAQQLVERHSVTAPLPPNMVHLAGLLAMRREDWPMAAERFAGLLASGVDAPAVRYNLAWSRAMAKDFDGAATVLNDETAEALPQAAQLQIGLLHQLGDMERAIKRAPLLLDLYPEHRGLNAVVSTLAIDAEDEALARRCADRAGDHPDALITQATLALKDGEITNAARLFDIVLERDPAAPRAWIGQGLVQLQSGQAAEAAQALDKGAELFGNHLGSWLASGWAHAISGDRATARARFERALAVDERFGEAQGSLAVMDILDGHADEARRRTEIALRLDRQGFAGALASIMLRVGDGDTEGARRIFERAMTVPIDGAEMTLATALVRFGSVGS